MPIRPENKSRYPKNWKEISASIRSRAGNKCEWCGIPNHAVGRWLCSKFHPVGGNIHLDLAGNGQRYPDLEALSYAEAYEIARKLRSLAEWSGEPHITVIVLTVAHLDHTPENCDPENLRALCQKCHNGYDAKHRAAGIKQRRAAKLEAEGFLPAGSVQ